MGLQNFLFPIEVAFGDTDEDYAFLEEHGDHCQVFESVNEAFIEDKRKQAVRREVDEKIPQGKKAKGAPAISTVTTEQCRNALEVVIDKGVPRTPLFYWVGKAYLTERFKQKFLNRPELQTPEKRTVDKTDTIYRMLPDEGDQGEAKDLTDRLIKAIEKHEKSINKMIKSVEDLEDITKELIESVGSISIYADPANAAGDDVIELGDVFVKRTHSLAGTAYFIKSSLQNYIEEMVAWGECLPRDVLTEVKDFAKMQLRDELKALNGAEKIIYQRDIPQTLSPADTTPYMYQLLGHVVDLIEMYWKTRGAKQATIKLFHNWGISVVTEEGVRKGQQRRSKRGDKLPP